MGRFPLTIVFAVLVAALAVFSAPEGPLAAQQAPCNPAVQICT